MKNIIETIQRENMDYQLWLKQVVDPSDIVCQSPELYRHAMEKGSLAERFAPRGVTVAEIGVKAGYSAHAFLSAMSNVKLYVGYDLFAGQYYSYDFEAGPSYANKILRRDFPSVSICLVTTNSQNLKSIGLKNVDLFHIDGDHSFNGCLHDMMIAWGTLSNGGIMLVDDYDFVPEVRSAVDKFLKDNQDSILFSEYFKTLRGDVVIKKK